MSDSDKSIFVQFKEILFRKGLEYFGKYYGVYRGSVVSNEDPDNLGRLRIKCPTLYGDNEPTYWAMGRGMIAGKGHGAYWIPQKGDPILVSCENGDARFPLWEYGWWLAGQVPENATPGNHIFRTPSGHRIEMDDNNEEIIISNAGGQTVRLKSDGIYLGNNTQNLGRFFNDLFALLESTTVTTSLGPQPFVNVLSYTALKLEIADFLKNTNT